MSVKYSKNKAKRLQPLSADRDFWIGTRKNEEHLRTFEIFEMISFQQCLFTKGAISNCISCNCFSNILTNIFSPLCLSVIFRAGTKLHCRMLLTLYFTPSLSYVLHQLSQIHNKTIVLLNCKYFECQNQKIYQCPFFHCISDCRLQ